MTDMTTGAPRSHLWRHALPLLLGNWMQLSYNAVDSIIAGRFIGKDALAAEGVAGPVMNLVILAITGLCIGAGVLMSEAFGARDYRRPGSEYLGFMALFYLFPAMTNGVQGFFRGMGKMYTTMVGTFLQAATRTACTFLLAPRFGIRGIAFSCAIGWSAMLLYEIPYYFITCKKKRLPRQRR